MRKDTDSLFILLGGNLIPFFLLALTLGMAWVPLAPFARLGLVLFVLYLLPPLVYRFLPHRKAQGTFQMSDKPFATWWIGMQLQALYLRAPVLEEILRIIPFAYSAWLRLWGAKIGKRVYWSPRIIIMDRPFLQIDSEVIVGYGVAFTAHHLNRNGNQMALVLATPIVEKSALLGGESRVGPGARVGAAEMLPATMVLAPFYEWRGGRRHSILKNQLEVSK